MSGPARTAARPTARGDASGPNRFGPDDPGPDDGEDPFAGLDGGPDDRFDSLLEELGVPAGPAAERPASRTPAAPRGRKAAKPATPPRKSGRGAVGRMSTGAAAAALLDRQAAELVLPARTLPAKRRRRGATPAAAEPSGGGLNVFTAGSIVAALAVLAMVALFTRQDVANDRTWTEAIYRASDLHVRLREFPADAPAAQWTRFRVEFDADADLLLAAVDSAGDGTPGGLVRGAVRDMKGYTATRGAAGGKPRAYVGGVALRDLRTAVAGTGIDRKFEW